MSLLDYITGESEQKKREKAWQQKCQQDAIHWHVDTRTYPIRMIFPMPLVLGAVTGGGSVYQGSGSISVAGKTETFCGLVIYYEREDGRMEWAFFRPDSVNELLCFTDEESHIIVKYQCADSDNSLIKQFYGGIFVNRHWQQTGR